jgi:hypothetical protein
MMIGDPTTERNVLRPIGSEKFKEGTISSENRRLTIFCLPEILSEISIRKSVAVAIIFN